ncbi:hypothetical protein ACLI4Z_14600 [Natrialbaceae archaeon A-arb3/5]
MTEEHDHDLPTDELEDEFERIDEIDAQQPIETAASMVTENLRRDTVSLAGGGLLVLSALRSAVRGQLRAIPKGIVGAVLVQYGLRERQSKEESTFDSLSPDREADESTASSDDAGSRIEFTKDTEGTEPRSKPDIDGEDDPRRRTDDESVSIDVSDTAMADETGEATGPDPEQAQPVQTDSIEPEETPDEDSSRLDDEETMDDDESDADETDVESDADVDDSNESE